MCMEGVMREEVEVCTVWGEDVCVVCDSSKGCMWWVGGWLRSKIRFLH